MFNRLHIILPHIHVTMKYITYAVYMTKGSGYKCASLVTALSHFYYNLNKKGYVCQQLDDYFIVLVCFGVLFFGYIFFSNSMVLV